LRTSLTMPLIWLRALSFMAHSFSGRF